MNKNTKIVNIYPSTPIIGLNPPIRSVVKNVTKSTKEIRTCLMSRAIVEEVLSNGKIIRLDISNYDKNLDIEIKPSNSLDHISKADESIAENKTLWQIAYEKALEGKDLASMTRKQRRSVQAAAKAEADAMVSNIDNSKDTEDTTSIESIKDNIDENNDVEEIVVTADAEDITSTIV